MFLQTANELEEATSDLLERLRMENVTYADIRFCPQLHTLESLTSEEALLAVIKGIFSPKLFYVHIYTFQDYCIKSIPLFYTMLGFQSEALKVNKDRIYGGVIVCALRSMTEEHGIEMAELAGKYLKVNRSTEFNSYYVVNILRFIGLV